MAFPPQYRDFTPNLPSIMSSGPGHYRLNHDRSFPGSSAMSIPGLAASRDVVPPPLPPPRHLPFLQGPPPPEELDKDGRDCENCSSSMTSDYGSLRYPMDERPGFSRRRDTCGSIHTDEGYASYTVSERPRDPRPTELFHPNKFRFKTAAELHCDSMKKKLDPICTVDRSPRSLNSSALSEQVRRHASPGVSTPSMPLQLPIHSRATLNSPGRLPDTLIFSAVSPHAVPFRLIEDDPRKAKDGLDDNDPPGTRSRRHKSDAALSTHGLYGLANAEEMDVVDATSPKRLHRDEAHTMAGNNKRRAASSPDGDHTFLYSAGVDGNHRENGSRSSPTPRLTIVPQTSSVSSVSSMTISRSNSYISTLSMAPSSATTANSLSHKSPGAASPGAVSPTSCHSPYATPTSQNQSPRNSISGRTSTRARNVSSPRKVVEIQKSCATKMQRVFVCDCCPKKPKKFETNDELRDHEAEKQYTCLFCGNRFKNKNEAERHQNSLHVRRHSWSCSALFGYDRAFHDSTSHPGEADTCGYCGDEFARSGRGSGAESSRGGSVTKHATEQDWDERIRHLQEVHKFRECNSSKKFYRADHFRQHLKHSHAGTSGKWTNMLENACMIEEETSPR